MRTINITLLTVVVVIVSASSALATVRQEDIKYLDFTGWDHTLISGGGQSFIGLDAGIHGMIQSSVLKQIHKKMVLHNWMVSSPS